MHFLLGTSCLPLLPSRKFLVWSGFSPSWFMGFFRRFHIGIVPANWKSGEDGFDMDFEDFLSLSCSFSCYHSHHDLLWLSCRHIYLCQLGIAVSADSICFLTAFALFCFPLFPRTDSFAACPIIGLDNCLSSLHCSVRTGFHQLLSYTYLVLPLSLSSKSSFSLLFLLYSALYLLSQFKLARNRWTVHCPSVRCLSVDFFSSSLCSVDIFVESNRTSCQNIFFVIGLLLLYSVSSLVDVSSLSVTFHFPTRVCVDSFFYERSRLVSFNHYVELELTYVRLFGSYCICSGFMLSQEEVFSQSNS